MKSRAQSNYFALAGIICVSVILTVGCNKQQPSKTTGSSETTGIIMPTSAVSITPIPPAPLPAFLRKVFPSPGERLSLEQYNTAGEEADQRKGSAVCVIVDGSPLLEEGDYWGSGSVMARTTIRVDGKERERTGYLADYIVEYQLVTEDDEGNVTIIAEVGGPYEWCVAAPLSTGVHRVDIDFSKSNGETVSFAWTFELTSGP